MGEMAQMIVNTDYNYAGGKLKVCMCVCVSLSAH